MEMKRQVAKSFHDLLVWGKAHEFVIKVYGLAQQMRRAAVSVPANIAEGFARRGKADKARFINIAEGSLEESRYFLILAQDLGYGSTDLLRRSAEEVGRLLGSYSRAILASDS